MTKFSHVPVLAGPVVQSFRSLPVGSIVIDGTFGRGGHSSLLLSKGHSVIAVDRDAGSEEAAREMERVHKGRYGTGTK